MINPDKFSKDELLNLLIDAAKNWLAHDGIWFQAVENNYGIEKAIELDKAAWQKFTVIEAKRIQKRFNLEPNGGIRSLVKALNFRLYSYINKQEIIFIDENKCVLKMNECRVQAARARKNLQPFPCKPVGLVEYEYFAKTIDPRINTKCLHCPPDSLPDDSWCAWEFSINS
jgi:hypothetical protein